MAVFTNLVPTSTVEDEDEILLHQNGIDKKIEFEVATALNWASLQGYTYEGKHETGTVYNTLNSFATSSGIAYFPKYNTTTPYTSAASNPATDTNLTRQSYRDYKASVDAVRDIGSTLQRFDAVNPNDLYPWQTWVLRSGDASIRLGDGTGQTSVPTGNNTPAVPLLAHAHTMNHDHPATTSSANGTHNHVGGHLENSQGNYPYGSTYLGANYTGSGRTDSDNSYMANTSTADNHQHTLDIPYYSGNTGSTGASTPTLDVRGKYIKMNLWLRTA